MEQKEREMTNKYELGKIAYEATHGQLWDQLLQHQRDIWANAAVAIIDYIRHNPGAIHGECEAGQ